MDFYTHRTVRWEDDKVVMIDQTKLPEEVSYITCTDHFQVASSIKSMVVRGAPAIGVAAAMGLALAAQNSLSKSKAELVKELESAATTLRETRPTAVNLFWAIQRILKRAGKEKGDVDAIKRALVKEAQRMGDEDVEANRRMGRFGADLLEDGDTILTHCS